MKRTKATWWQRYSLYVIVPAGLIAVFLIGLVLGLSWGNYLGQKADLSPAEEAVTRVQVTSDDSWHGVSRR